jgi:hypothetical protein
MTERQQYWLHVLSNGTELKFDHNPLPILSLLVRVISEAVEETYTYNVGAISVPPRGAGWSLRRRGLASTSWRRKKRRATHVEIDRELERRTA